MVDTSSITHIRCSRHDRILAVYSMNILVTSFLPAQRKHCLTNNDQNPSRIFKIHRKSHIFRFKMNAFQTRNDL